MLFSLGPVMRYELITTSRRRRYYVLRVIYGLVLLTQLWGLFRNWEAEHEAGALRRPFYYRPSSLEEVQAFADVNVAWLSKVLSAAGVVGPEKSEERARAIFAAVAGAQLMARSRSDISLFDALIESYRVAGLLPAQTAQSSIADVRRRGPASRRHIA